jgi:FkbM family methyltransferase
MDYYSQAGEDKWMIEHHLSNFPAHKRIYFEAGALDGVLYSNTLSLEKNYGWTGILVEPNPVSFSALMRNRPNNLLLNCLCSDEKGDIEYRYFTNPDLAAVSAVSNTMPEQLFDEFYNENTNNKWLSDQQKTLQTIKLKPRSMASILNESGFDCVGFASLDVEGHELNVLRSHDFDFPIEFFLIETHNEAMLVEFMESRGYSLLNKLAHNILFHRPIT